MGGPLKYPPTRDKMRGLASQEAVEPQGVTKPHVDTTARLWHFLDMKKPQRPTVERTQAELLELYNDTLDALVASCSRFDRRDTREYRHISSIIRNLCRDTRMSKSLLGQVGLTQRNFLTCSPAINPGNELSECHLVELIIRPKVPDKPASWQAVLDSAPMDFVPFTKWWLDPIVVQPSGNSFSRSDLVGYVADQDGGVHVDPAIDAAFQEMRTNAFTYSNGRTTTEHVDRHAIRQIAHELCKSLRPNFRRSHRLIGDYAIFRVPSFRKDRQQETVPLIGYHTSAPEGQCPCGSGLVFRSCHQRGISAPVQMQHVSNMVTAPPGAAYAQLSFDVN